VRTQQGMRVMVCAGHEPVQLIKPGRCGWWTGGWGALRHNAPSFWTAASRWIADMGMDSHVGRLRAS
jgi:hypothetical protein